MERAFIFLLATVGSVSSSTAQSIDLYFDVTLNDVPRHLVSHFVDDGRGGICSSASELREIGLAIANDAEDPACLSELKGVTYSIDEAHQTIAITAPLSLLQTTRIDLAHSRGSRKFQPPSQDLNGFLLNYDVRAFWSNDLEEYMPAFNGASTSLDASFFGPWGSLSQSMLAGNTTVSTDFSALRLDSVYSWIDPDAEFVFRGGDIISGGVPWSRPIRIGGAQVSRDFGLRPDLVTVPLPSIVGTAVVPSSLDLYVNGAHTFSQKIAPGPFALGNIPAITGGGTTKLVLRDATGNEVQRDVPYYVSPNLLKGGIYDYSIEVGEARLGYGVSSFDYDDQIVGSASGRFGLTDWLTLIGHVEGSQDLANLGLGVDFPLAYYGAVSVAGAASFEGARQGALIYAAYDFQSANFSFSAESKRTFGDYRDLATITARKSLRAREQNHIGGASGFYDFGSALPPKSVDRVSLGLPFNFLDLSLSMSFTNYVDADDNASRIASVSVSRPLPASGTIYATLLQNYGDDRGTTVFAGVTFPLGSDQSVSTTVQSDRGKIRTVLQETKSPVVEPGSFSWNVVDAEGDNAFRLVEGDYLSSYGRIGGQLAQTDNGFQGTVRASGSVAKLQGTDFHVGPHVYDGFAVVKSEAPNVPVSVENRVVGKTGSDGELLISNLRSYDQTDISIDPATLPANATFGSIRKAVATGFRTGTIVDFGVDVDATSLVIHFVDAAGADVPPGTSGTFDNVPFVVGYDGLAYLQGIKKSGVATLELTDAECRAHIDFKPAAAIQKIGPVRCAG